jgi:hypothetical protein
LVFPGEGELSSSRRPGRRPSGATSILAPKGPAVKCLPERLPRAGRWTGRKASPNRPRSDVCADALTPIGRGDATRLPYPLRRFARRKNGRWGKGGRETPSARGVWGGTPLARLFYYVIRTPRRQENPSMRRICRRHPNRLATKGLSPAMLPSPWRALAAPSTVHPCNLGLSGRRNTLTARPHSPTSAPVDWRAATGSTRATAARRTATYLAIGP